MIITACAYLIFVILLCAASYVDSFTLYIPNYLFISLVGLWAAWRIALGIEGVVVGIGFITACVNSSPMFGISLPTGIVGAIVCGGGVLVAIVVYELITHKRVLGMWDIKLLACTGLFLGSVGGLLCLLVGCIIAGFSSISTAFRHRLATPKEDVHTALVPVRVLKGITFAPGITIGALISIVVLLFIWSATS